MTAIHIYMDQVKPGLHGIFWCLQDGYWHIYDLKGSGIDPYMTYYYHYYHYYYKKIKEEA